MAVTAGGSKLAGARTIVKVFDAIRFDVPRAHRQHWRRDRPALPPENATGNYVKIVQRIPVKLVLEPGENRDRQLRPGMSAIPTVYVR